MTWVVYRCFNDGHEDWRRLMAEFETETEAEQFAEAEERCDASGVWYVVECE